MRRMIVVATVPLAVFATWVAEGGASFVRAEPKRESVKEQPKQPGPASAPGAPMPGPEPRPGSAIPAGGSGGAANRYAVEMLFIDPAGATLASRVVPITAGKTETVVVQQGGRTISAETTVRPGAKAGCNRVDVVLRDRTIDATGRLNKTVWQSGSEPCGPAPITLGPKTEVNLRIAIQVPK